jgi:hypothetical protein
MAIFKLFQGGDAPSAATGVSFPSNVSPASSGQSFADHQRARDYDVTRVLDTRAPTLYASTGKDRALTNWLKNNALAVGDVLQLTWIPANSLIKALSYTVISPLAGFAFDLRVAGTTAFAAVNAGTVSPSVQYFTMPAGFVTASNQFVELVITALPVQGLVSVAGTTGFVGAVTAHVHDLRPNGNAA